MGIFNWETFFGKQKQQEGEEQEEDAVLNPSDWSLSPKKTKKHVIVTPAPAATTKEDKENEEQERSEKKKRVTQEKEEGLNPSDRSPKKKRRAERKDEFEMLGGPIRYVVYDRDHNPSESTNVELVGFCNNALEKYNNDNNHNCLYEYARLLKAVKTVLGSRAEHEIIFDASLPHKDGFRFETFEASISTGLHVQKGVEGYGKVVSTVGKYTGRVGKYTGSDYGPRFW